MESTRLPPERGSNTARGLTALATGVLVAGAIAISLYYGRRGFMALDQSIVFDGGWRLISGQRPYLDFSVPAGLVPMAMQAVAFQAVGLNWFAYCLHAAVMNALFALLVQSLLRDAGMGRTAAWMLAALSAVVFYPPFGTPYPDQHAFFFSTASVWAALRAWQRQRSLWWIVAAVWLGGLAALSKPIPTAFVVPIAGAILVFAVARRGRVARLTLAWSVVAGVAGLLIAIWMLGLPLGSFIADTVITPARHFSLRMKPGSRLPQVWHELSRTVDPFSPWVLAAINGAMAVAFAVGVAARRWIEVPAAAWTPLLLADALGVASAAFIEKTNNHSANGLALMFVVLGLATLACDRVLTRPGALARVLRSACWVVVLALAALDGWRFNTAVNRTRVVHDQRFDEAEPRWSPGRRLAYMQLNRSWSMFNPTPAIKYVESRQANFLLLGDSSVLYGLTGRPSVMPALWLHQGLTFAEPGAAAFGDFENRLLDRMRAFDVQFVIQEGPWTQTGVTLEMFPRLAARVKDCPSRAVEMWMVLDLCR